MNSVTNTQPCLAISLPTLTVVVTSIDMHLQQRKLRQKIDRWTTLIQEDSEKQRMRYPTVEEMIKGLKS